MWPPSRTASTRRGPSQLAELLHVCPFFYIEALYSARSPDDLAQLESELAALSFLALGERAHETVGLAFRELSSAPIDLPSRAPPDTLIAAIAHESGVGVLHYDAHYDRLAEVLAFESRWIAPRGTLD